MKDVASFVQDVERVTIGAPEPAIEREILHSSREFLHDTLVWVHESMPQIIRNNINEYVVVTPSGSRLEVLQEVYAGEKKLIVLPLAAYPYNRSSVTGMPSHSYLTETGRIRLYPTPDRDDIGNLQVIAVLNVKEGGKKVPDALYDRYSDAIVSGAIARLTAQPDQLWSNPQLSAHHRQMFRRAKSSAVNARVRGNAAGSVMINRQSFG